MKKLIRFRVAILVEGQISLLGYVMAEHQPAAVLKAWKKWPQHVKDMPQGGFSVLVAKD